MSEEKKVIKVGRRRHTEPAPPEGRQRAEAPRRRETDQGGQPPSFGGFGGGSSGSSGSPIPFPFPSGGKLSSRSCLGLIALVLIVVCVFSVMQFFGSSESGTNDTSYTISTDALQGLAPAVDNTLAPVVIPTRSARKKPTATPATVSILPAEITPFTQLEETPFSATEIAAAEPPAGKKDTWLVMLYQDADDKILEQDIYFDLNEAERVGSSDSVTIVAQLDRYRGGFQGGGNWAGARRYYVTQDNDLNSIHSQQLADLGEVNMADGNVLVDFVSWAMSAYPADKYALILSDHGMGWPGGWSDADSHGGGDARIPLASRLGDQLYLNELDQALLQIRKETGLQKLELIGLDACLMGQIEVLSSLEPYARYAVVSEETEPSLGWAYTGFLQGLSQDPSMSGAELSKLVVQSYIQSDERIVDPQARAEFLRQGSPMSGLFGLFGDVPPQQLAQQLGQEATLSAIDLSAVPELNSRLNELSLALQGADQSLAARARSYAQSFTSIFGSKVPPSYIDLGNFVQLLERESRDSDLKLAGDKVLAAIDQAVIIENHGSRKPGATGITIFFPNSQIYKNPVTGAESYTLIANRFAKESLWDDYLAYHYTGLSFEANAARAAVPATGAVVRAPGAGQIEISSIQLSDTEAAPGRPVTLSADIRGQNIGFIYLFVGYYDQSANSIYVADTDYLESSDTRQIQGVYYPVWGEENEFTLQFDWEPVVFAVSDGLHLVTALFHPQSYGATFEQAIYTVDGTYTFADSGDTRQARLYFSDGKLTRVNGITGQGELGAPSEITPSLGDTFTVQETWMDLDPSGKVAQIGTQDGATLTFGDQAFTWEELDAAAGEYIVGFIIDDLDGNSNESYTQVSVR